MGYLRLFIELQNEISGEAAGQARVELQDRPGRVDIKVRGVMMGLTEGDTYQAALVSEHMGRYQEYPLGACTAGPRGQATLMYRGSFPAEPGDNLGVGGFKAFIARCGGKRVVGYRFEKLAIPDGYEEPVRPQEPQEEEQPAAEAVPEAEAEIVMEAAPEPEMEPEAAPAEEPAPATEPESKTETRALPEPVYVLHDLEQVDQVCGSAGKRAFERYHHLILIQQGGENLLGMPCRYRSSQQEELAGEGYQEFVTPHGGAPSYGEFGYWVKKLG